MPDRAPETTLGDLSHPVAQRDRLAQSLRLLRDASSVDSYAYNVAVSALAEAGIPEPPEEDHP